MTHFFLYKCFCNFFLENCLIFLHFCNFSRFFFKKWLSWNTLCDGYFRTWQPSRFFFFAFCWLTFPTQQSGKYFLLPPGPYGRPILGIIPYIKKEFHLLLTEYSQEFGSIYSFKMGKETMVVLADHNIIKKAFRSRNFVARPKSELSTILNGYGKSTIHFMEFFFFENIAE